MKVVSFENPIPVPALTQDPQSSSLHGAGPVLEFGPGSPHPAVGATDTSTAHSMASYEGRTYPGEECTHLELLHGFFLKSEKVVVTSNPSVLNCLLRARVVCPPYRRLGVKNVIHCLSIKLFLVLVHLFLPLEQVR
jgi:hypothetical protein